MLPFLFCRVKLPIREDYNDFWDLGFISAGFFQDQIEDGYKVCSPWKPGCLSNSLYESDSINNLQCWGFMKGAYSFMEEPLGELGAHKHETDSNFHGLTSTTATVFLKVPACLSFSSLPLQLNSLIKGQCHHAYTV